MWFVFRLVVVALRAAVHSRADLMLENVALRHQLEVGTAPETDGLLFSRSARLPSAEAGGALLALISSRDSRRDLEFVPHNIPRLRSLALNGRSFGPAHA